MAAAEEGEARERAAEGAAAAGLGDLPEACLAHAIALTSPRDASRCAAVSPAFRAAADSDHVWARFIPDDDCYRRGAAARQGRGGRKKQAFLALCDGGGGSGVPVGGDAGCRAWLDRATGAKCYALSARRLSLPWDDGEFSWRWVTLTHPRSRFGEVAELVDCTFLDIYGALPGALLTPPPASYAAYLVYATAEGHRGLSFPDQEGAVSLGGGGGGGHAEAPRRAVCLRPDEAEARKFWGPGAVAPPPPSGGEGPRLRDDGWWEVELGWVPPPPPACAGAAGEEEETVVASFEVLGSYPKRGLIVEAVEFRPHHSS